jgi:small subunit ribosomal protein S2
MTRVPSAIWVVDTKKEHIAVDEARKLGIPVIAVLDTNCDPDEVDFPIPGNDDAIRSAELLTRVIATAVADGLIARSGRGRGGADEKPEPGAVAAGEPLPEWERDLYEGAEKKAAEDAVPAEAAAPAAEKADEKADESAAPAEAAAPAAEKADEKAADKAAEKPEPVPAAAAAAPAE